MTLKETAVFCRKLSFMLDAGMPVKAAIKVLSEQSAPRMKRALAGLDICISRGDGLANAFAAAKVFPKLLCGLVSLGERTARLPEVTGQAADYYDELAETQNEMVSALAYPLLVSMLMFAVMVLAVTFVLPSYEQVFTSSGVELPFITRSLLDMSAFFADRGALLFAFGGGIAGIAFLYLKSPNGTYLKDSLLLHFPLYKKYINARFSQVLALMLSAGQSVADALPVCAEVMTNKKVTRDLYSCAVAVSSGKSLREALSEVRYTDNLLKEMIRVGEETGRLSQSLSKSRVYFQCEYSSGIKRLNKLIEPVLTVVLGAMVGLLMLAVVLPTFRLADVGW